VSHVEVDRQTSYPIFFEITFRVPILHTRESKNDEEDKLSPRLAKVLIFEDASFKRDKRDSRNVASRSHLIITSAVSTTILLGFQSPRKKTAVSEKQSICHTCVIPLISHLYNQKSCASCNNLYKSDLNYCAPVTDCYMGTLPCDISQLPDPREK